MAVHSASEKTTVEMTSLVLAPINIQKEQNLTCKK